MALEVPASPVNEADLIFNVLTEKIANLPEEYRKPIQNDIARLAQIFHTANPMDLNGQNHTEQALWVSEQKFQSIFQNAPFPIVLLNARDSTVVDTNQAFLELFGFQRDEVIGRTAVALGVVPDPAARAEIFKPYFCAKLWRIYSSVL